MSSSVPPPPPPPPSELSGGGSVPAGAGVLAELAELLGDTDRLFARIVTVVGRALDAGVAEAVCQVTLERWLSCTGRVAASARRDLLRVVRVLRRMPATAAGLADGRLSWSQTVAVVGAAKGLAVEGRERLDGLIGARLDEFAGYEPDVLVEMVFDQVDRLDVSRLERAERVAADDEFVALSPRLFGGGSFYGEYGPEHFALLAEALDAGIRPPPATTHHHHDGHDDGDGDGDGGEALVRRQRRVWRHYARRRAARLAEVLRDSLAGHTDDGGRVPARPSALITIDADSLCRRTAEAGWLLTTLAGGRLKVSASFARRLVDTWGVDQRLVVLDETGEVVGVGRRTRQPPGWLRDAVAARDLVDTAPGSRIPVRRCDLDHVQAWQDGGATEVSNLVAVGRRAHGAKTRGQATLARARDGTITWTPRDIDYPIVQPPTRRRLDQPAPPSRLPPRPPPPTHEPDHDPPGDPPGDPPAP